MNIFMQNPWKFLLHESVVMAENSKTLNLFDVK